MRKMNSPTDINTQPHTHTHTHTHSKGGSVGYRMEKQELRFYQRKEQKIFTYFLNMENM
jgi:hypothetical protein